MTYAFERVRSLQETNSVLRNTFMLLALSLLPTIFGAWFGMESGFNAWVSLHPGYGFLVLLGSLFGLIFAVQAAADTALGVILLLIFTAVMGLMMSGAIEATLHLKNGHLIVGEAVGGTAIVCFSCGLYAMTTKRDFSSLGGTLFGILLAVVIIGFINIWLQLPMLSLVLSVVSTLLFSVYLIYDVQDTINGGETNYVLATMRIYLDVMNIFVNLLNILGIVNGDD